MASLFIVRCLPWLVLVLRSTRVIGEATADNEIGDADAGDLGLPAIMSRLDSMQRSISSVREQQLTQAALDELETRIVGELKNEVADAARETSSRLESAMRKLRGMERIFHRRHQRVSAEVKQPARKLLPGTRQQQQQPHPPSAPRTSSVSTASRPAAATIPTGECPGDFVRVSSVNGCYRFVRQNLNWNEATTMCRRLNDASHLVVIDNAAEQSAIEGLINETAGLSSCNHYGRSLLDTSYWTAGRLKAAPRDRPTAKFVWKTKTAGGGNAETELEYTNWHSGEPNNARGDENCIEISHGSGDQWNDQICRQRMCFICEINM